jgi:hypothetical protein
MESGYAYWVDMKEAGTLTVSLLSSETETTGTQLSAGMNFVGFNGTEEMNIRSALASIDGFYSEVLAYESGRWIAYDPNAPDAGELSVMKPGRGYPIHATARCVWHTSVTMCRDKFRYGCQRKWQQFQ